MSRPRIAPLLTGLGPILGLLVLGCASVDLGPTGSAQPRSHQVADVPFIAQSARQCGPAALAMALQHAGLALTEADVAPAVFTPDRRGSFAQDLVGAARRLGHVPYPIADFASLFDEVRAGSPVVVLQNLGLSWLPRWHFAVVIGFDLDRGTLTLHSGSRAARSIPLFLFARTWNRADRWGRVILPPEELPASLPERDVLAAVAPLESMGQGAAARVAYGAAAARWPQSSAARMGLGNASYAQGDKKAAEVAFREALELDPALIPAANNLAHLLGETGRPAEGRALLEPRLETAGAWRPTLERTLRSLAPREGSGEPKGPTD